MYHITRSRDVVSPCTKWCATRIRECVWDADSYTWRDSFMCVSWLIHRDVISFLREVACDMNLRVCGTCHLCDVTLLYDSFICVTWLIRRDVVCLLHELVCDKNSRVCVSWLIHMCDMTHSCVTWLIHMCDMTHSYVWHDSFICVTWLIHMCDMTHSCVTCLFWGSFFASVFHHVEKTHSHRKYEWHDAFECVTWLIYMCDMIHSYVWRDSSIYVTWLTHLH